MIICNVVVAGKQSIWGMLKMADGNYNAEVTAKVVSTEQPTTAHGTARSDGA